MFLILVGLLFMPANPASAQDLVSKSCSPWNNCQQGDSDIGLNQEAYCEFTLLTNAAIILTVTIEEQGFMEEAYTATWEGVDGTVEGDRTKIAKAFITPEDTVVKILIKDGGTTWPGQNIPVSGGADICLNHEAELSDCFIMDISFEKYPLPLGESGESTADIRSYEADCTNKWVIIGDALGCTIDEDTGLVTAGCTDGEIIVRTYLVSDPAHFKEKRLLIGGGQCGAACQNFGDSNHNLGSIHSTFSLGSGLDGKSAGAIVLKSDVWTPQILHPNFLKYNSIRHDIQVLRDSFKTIRQIKYPEGLVDIQITATNAYAMSFYTNAFSSTTTDGYYVVTSAEPVVIYQIGTTGSGVSNPTNVQNLIIQDIRGIVTNVVVYTYKPDTSTSEWSLVTGNGLRHETLQVWGPSSNRFERRTIQDSNSNIAYQVDQVFNATTNMGKLLLRQVVDPLGAGLVTSNQYDALSGRLIKSVGPGGFEQTMQYDAVGRIVVQSSTWKDASVRTISNQYATTGIELFRPRTAVEYIDGILVRKTTYSYATNSSGERIEIIEAYASQSASPGDAYNQVTTNVYYPKSTNASSEKLKSTSRPDGRWSEHTYEYGAIVITNAASGDYVFTPGTGQAVRETVTHGTVQGPAGVAGKSLREISVRRPTGAEVVREIQVYTGSGYERIDWTIHEHDHYGRITKSYFPNSTFEESFYSNCCGKEWQEDRTGILTIYSYDELKRVISEERTGIDLAYTYDAEGRVLTRTQSADSLSLVSSNEYDVAGRLVKSVDEQQLVTEISYVNGGLQVTRTLPGSFTEITEHHVDGQVKSITGTGVPHRFYEYGVEGNGHQWTLVWQGATNSPMWEKTTTDLLGQTVQVERPDFGGAQTSSIEYEYNTKGQLIRLVNPHRADTLFEYDELGNQMASGLDLNNNTVLNRDGIDRVSETETIYEVDGSNVFRVSISKIYPDDDSGIPLTNSIQKSRLLGWSEQLAEDQYAIDLHGQTTRTYRIIVRTNQQEIVTVNYPDSQINEAQIFVDGRLISQTTKTGLTQSNAYDALGRLEQTTASNGGSQLIEYNVIGQVVQVINAASNRTTFGYDLFTGHRIAETNAQNGTVYFAYNAFGNVTSTWGTAVYPINYQYDPEGRLLAMTTFRGTNGPGDATIWHYDAASGLLTNKHYADGKGPVYSYTPDGLLAERQWARGITSSYAYDSAGNMTNITYSDGTPSVAIAYDRIGRKKAMSDALGQRTFSYHSTLELSHEAIAGLYTNTLVRGLDGMGRIQSFEVAGGNYSIAYAHDSVGRLAAITSIVGVATSHFVYTYSADADLIASLVAQYGQSNVMTTLREYDVLNRLTEIENRDGESIAFSRYRYGYDALDRRTNVQHLAGDYWSYDYNSRSELTNAVRRWPDNAMVYGQDFAYVYDAIGNRTVSTRDGQSSLYNANELNQYSNRTLPGTIHVLGSAHTNAMVLVNEQPASRQEEYFHEALVVDNDEAAVYPLINVMGLRAGAGPEGEDVVRVETGHVFLAQTPEVFIYDDDGNLLEDGRWLYTWDGENRLIAMETHTNLTGIITMKKLEFTYDGESRRISKKVYRDEEGDWELEKEWRFVYDGWNLVRELDGGNTPVRSYIWGLDLSQSLQGAGGVGGLLAIVDIADDSVYYAAYDGNGNLTALVDSLDGDQSAIYEYDAYGNIIRLSGEYASQNPFRFSTKYADDETDLVYYGFRYYDAPTGRWLSPDPLGDQAFYRLYVRGKSARQQRELKRSALIPPYLFVLNNPVTFIDVYGLNLWDSVVTKGKEFCCMVGVLGLDGAINLKNLADQVDEVARNDYPDPADALTKVNALKHCFGSCALKKLYGEDAARKLSDCHETHDVYQDPQDRATDEFNNNVGYGFADAGLNCYDACKAAVDRDDGTLDLDPYH